MSEESRNKTEEKKTPNLRRIMLGLLFIILGLVCIGIAISLTDMVTGTILGTGTTAAIAQGVK